MIAPLTRGAGDGGRVLLYLVVERVPVRHGVRAAPLLRTISVGLALLQSVPNFPPQTNIIMAAATAVTVPVLLLFITMQRQFIGRMTAGAVK